MHNKEYIDAFKAFGDNTRLKIVNMLKGRTMCACELLEKLNITQPTLSHHMKILQQTKIVNAEKKGIWMHYSINYEVIKTIITFFSNLEV